VQVVDATVDENRTVHQFSDAELSAILRRRVGVVPVESDEERPDGHGPGLRPHRHGIARTQRTIRSCAWQCDKQGTDVHESAGVSCSVRIH
jgi:hypothetical protein